MLLPVNEPRLRVLWSLCSEGLSTARGVALRSGVSPNNALTILGALEAEGVVAKRRVGRASLYTLDPSREHTAELLSLAERRWTEGYLGAHPAERAAAHALSSDASSVCTVLFGSRVRGSGEDLDALLVTDDPATTARSAAEAAAVSGLDVSPLAIPPSRLLERLGWGEPLLASLLVPAQRVVVRGIHWWVSRAQLPMLARGRAGWTGGAAAR